MLDFDPLWKIMSEKGISANELFRRGFPQTTYYRIKRGADVRISTLAELCRLLDCQLEDIARYTKTDKNT